MKNIKIAKQLIKISKQLISFKNVVNKVDQDKQQEYAEQMARSLRQCFQDERLKQPFMTYSIYVNPSRYVKGYIGKRRQEIKVFLTYVDVVDKKQYDHQYMQDIYSSGLGQAINNKGMIPAIVIYGDSQQFYNYQYFYETFIHECMHVFDDFANIDDNYKPSYFGHPVKGIKDNGGIPYPGMYGGIDDFLDHKFAQYYTCRAERREYIYNLKLFIKKYAEKYDYSINEVKDILKQSLNNEDKFFNFYDSMPDDIDYAPLAMLYHLTFSKQSNGNKTTAVNILNNIKI